MTIEVPDAQAFVEDYLRTKVSSCESLSGGDWSTAYGFQAGEQHLVARFGSHVDDFEKDRAASRLVSEDLPVPQILAIGEAFDGYFCISERKFGVMLETLSPVQMRRIIPGVFKMLDALRIADVNIWCREIGEVKETWPLSMLEVDEEDERICGWHDKLALNSAVMETYQRGLHSLKSYVNRCPFEYSVRHRDLLHNNVLVDKDRITGVIDWGCARIGDFLHDVALLHFYTPWFPAMAEINWAMEAKAHYERIGLSVPEFEDRLKCYGIHIGLVGMTYSAFTDDLQELGAHSRRLEGLLDR